MQLRASKRAVRGRPFASAGAVALASLAWFAGAAGSPAVGGGLVLQRVGPAPAQIPPLLRRRASSVAPPDAPLAIKDDLPSTRWVVPRFTVDTRSPTGETTLVAVRNPNPFTVNGGIVYFSVHSAELMRKGFELASKEILTVNLRDVPAVVDAADPDGLARGWVRVTSATHPVTGDFFQVDPGQDFASGMRMFDLERELCRKWEVRFLQGGPFSSGTVIDLLITNPQGADPQRDPRTLIIDVWDEDATRVATYFGWTDQTSLELRADEVVLGVPFGVLRIEFAVGYAQVAATYRAEGRYSVGIKGLCVSFD